MTTPTGYSKDRAVEAKSDRLKGQTIAVGVCGGIAAVEIVKVIRELRRHGAQVTPFMTAGATRFITPLSVEWAADSKAVLSEGAEVEYLEPFDLVLVAPATLNTIHKAAAGLADNSVTLLVATQIARRGKVCFVPTMNVEMAGHPLFEESRDRLSKWGCKFFEAPVDEWRFKMPESGQLVEWLL